MTRDLGMRLVTDGCVYSWWRWHFAWERCFSCCCCQWKGCVPWLLWPRKKPESAIGVMLYTQNKSMPWWIFWDNLWQNIIFPNSGPLKNNSWPPVFLLPTSVPQFSAVIFPPRNFCRTSLRLNKMFLFWVTTATNNFLHAIHYKIMLYWPNSIVTVFILWACVCYLLDENSMMTEVVCDLLTILL